MMRWYKLSLSPKILNIINCSDGTPVSIKESNNNSHIIKVVKGLTNDSSKERFYDFLLENYDALKLMTNALIDTKKTDETTPVFLFSSSLEKDPDDGRESRREFSERCKYRLYPEMRSLSTIIQPYQQMLASGKIQSDSIKEEQLMQEKKQMIFCINDLYGYPLESQMNQGFIDRTKLLSLSNIYWDVYEDLIAKFLQMEVGSVFQHICWCKKHHPNPYAILILGHNEIGDLRCPTCSESLYSARFVSLNPQFESLLKYHGGFIPALIGWYLTKESIEWTADIKFNQHEYGDVIFKHDEKYYLIECKIRSRNKKERGIRNGIEKALTQAIEHTKYWEDHNIKIEKTDIFTNELDNNTFQKELQNAMGNKSKEIDGRKIKVHPIKLIPELITKLIE